MLEFFKNFWKRWVKKENETLRDTIEELIEETEEVEPSIASDERLLLENVLNLRDLNVGDVMIPRADIIAGSINADPDELINIIIKNNLTTLPVYNHTLDSILGILHIKDVLAWLHKGRQVPIKQILREVFFVSPSMLILDLLIQMRESGTRMALVVDEYGGVDGLVTFSKVIGEVVGDLQDADLIAPVTPIEIKDNGNIIADGRVTLEDIVEYLDHSTTLFNDAEDEEIDTIGGLVAYFAGRVPVKGEIIKHPYASNIEFEIIDANPRKINRLCIHKL